MVRWRCWPADRPGRAIIRGTQTPVCSLHVRNVAKAMTKPDTYPGGKGQIFRQLINQIPPHSTYVAAFAGRDAIARHKRPADRTVLIDRDSEVLSTWLPEAPTAAAVANNGEVADGRGLELWNCCGIEWLRIQFALDLALPSPVTKSGEARAWPHLATEYSDSFVYLDPPYLMETRRGGDLYRHELDDDGHDRLIETALALPCSVMISGYWSERYANAFASWRHMTVNAVDRAGNVREEWVWMNYDAPVELHDDRYFGKTANDRYKSKLKIDRTLAKLQALSWSERQTVLAALSRASG